MMITDAIVVCGLVLLSLAYCISCTRWANEMSRKCRRMIRWVEEQQAAEGVGPYDEDGGGDE